MLEVKVFKNLRVEEPREKVLSCDGVVLPAMTSLSVGVVDPIPMFPLAKMVKREAPDEEATVKGLVAPVPLTVRV